MSGLKGFIGAIVLGSVLMTTQKAPAPNYDFSKLELTKQDLVDIITDYTIVHQPLPQMKGGLYGMTSFREKKIYLSDAQEMGELRDTVIHEFYHAKFQRMKVEASEELVTFLADITVKKWYGDEYMKAAEMPDDPTKPTD